MRHTISNKIFVGIFVSFFASISFIPFALALPDFDADGTADFLVVEITDGGLVWRSHLSSTSFGTATELGTIGDNGDHLIPGKWLSSTQNLIGAASYAKNDNAVTWSVLNGSETSSFEFGRGKDLIVSGGDFDGNGITDAALIQTDGDAVVRLNPLASSSQAQLAFPKSAARRGKALFINRNGTNDELALLESRINDSGAIQYILHVRGLQGDTARINLGRGSQRWDLKDAQPIATSAGTDAVLVEEQNKQTIRVRVLSLDGNEVYEGEFESKPEIVIGNYTSEAGEEFAAYDSGAAQVVNPFTAGTSSVSGLNDGVAADIINVNRFTKLEGGAASPALLKVCPTIRGIGGGEIYKTIGSDHFTDARRGAANFIVAPGGRAVRSSCIQIYDARGTQIYALGAWPNPGPDWLSRHYGSIGCSSGVLSGSSLAGIARRNTRSETVYLKVDTRTCIEIPDAGRCINSKSC